MDSRSEEPVEEMPGDGDQRIVKLALLAGDLDNVETQSTEARVRLRREIDELDRLAAVRSELERRMRALTAEGETDE